MRYPLRLRVAAAVGAAGGNYGRGIEGANRRLGAGKQAGRKRLAAA